MGTGGFWKEIFKKGAVLDPADRISEVLYGSIMALTFTGAISVSTATPDDVRQLMWAAMGCNFAWGLVDAIMNLMSALVERGHEIAVIRRIKNTEGEEGLQRIVSEEMPALLSKLITPEESQALGQRLKGLPEPPVKGLLNMQDLVSFIQIFVLVFVCTLPIALPFVFMHDLHLAMRVSNGIALIMLFSGGHVLARYAGFRPLPTALSYTALGLLLVALTMALGG